MKKVSLLVLCLALGGCLGPSEAELAAADDAKCRSFGSAPGTDAYTNCRVALDTQRANGRALRRAVVLNRALQD